MNNDKKDIKTVWRHHDPKITESFCKGERILTIRKNLDLEVELPKITDPKEIILNGVLYPSISKAAIGTGIDPGRILRAINKDNTRTLTLSIDDNSSNRHKRIYCINGITYNGAVEAAQGLGVSVSTIKEYASKAGTYHFYIKKINRHRTVRVNGITYNTVSAAVRATGMTYSSLRKLSMQQEKE